MFTLLDLTALLGPRDVFAPEQIPVLVSEVSEAMTADSHFISSTLLALIMKSTLDYLLPRAWRLITQTIPWTLGRVRARFVSRNEVQPEEVERPSPEDVTPPSPAPSAVETHPLGPGESFLLMRPEEVPPDFNDWPEKEETAIEKVNPGQALDHYVVLPFMTHKIADMRRRTALRNRQQQEEVRELVRAAVDEVVDDPDRPPVSVVDDSDQEPEFDYDRHDWKHE